MLTKRKALEKTIEMWSWLAESPNEDADDYFHYKGVCFSDRPYCDCYCCEYDEISKGYCHNCPIKNWNYNDNDISVLCTNDEKSALMLFLHSEDKTERKNYALRIVQLAKKALKEFDGKEDFVTINKKEISLSIVKENMLPRLSGTRDFNCLLESLSFDELKKIEHILKAYPNKIDMEVPRDEDGTPQFDGEFKLIVKDNSYEENGFEILVLKWIEDYEDTGYLVDCLKED